MLVPNLFYLISCILRSLTILVVDTGCMTIHQNHVYTHHDRNAPKYTLGDVTVRNHDLHNGIILSTLNLSSHSFAFGFLKRPRTNGDSVSCL